MRGFLFVFRLLNLKWIKMTFPLQKESLKYN